jgi:thiamine pyrophosphokinase
VNDRGTIVVFTGGDPVPVGVLDDVPDDTFVIAADSGIDHALAHGRRVDLAVGDFDSVTPEALDAIAKAGAVIDRHPIAKDKTDFELALDHAIARYASRVIVVGGHGGRVDHLVGNLSVLLSDAYDAATIEARTRDAHVHVVRSRVELQGEPGDIVTLLAMAGPVHGVTTNGLRYPLDGEVLWPGSSRGVSNELVRTDGAVLVQSGTLLVIHVVR